MNSADRFSRFTNSRQGYSKASMLTRYLAVACVLAVLPDLTVRCASIARQRHIDSRLIASVLSNDEQGTIAALADGASPNAMVTSVARFSDRMHALFGLAHNGGCPVLVTACASLRINVNIVSYLLSHGADVNGTDPYGNSPLLCAVQAHNFNLLPVILRSHPDLAHMNCNGSTAIELALGPGVSPLKALLDAGANPNQRDGAGCTALAIACEIHLSYAKRIVSLLLDYGADTENVDSGGCSALCRADGPTAELLIERGANPEKTDADGKTPLITACELGNDQVAEVLCRHNVNVNAHGLHGETATQVAFRYCSLDTIRVVFSASNRDACHGFNYEKALVDSVGNEDARVCQWLLAKDADPLIKNAAVQQALCAALTSLQAFPRYRISRIKALKGTIKSLRAAHCP